MYPLIIVLNSVAVVPTLILLTVVVAKVVVPVTVNRLDTVEVPATREVAVALVVVRLVIKAVIDESRLEKKEVEVAADPEALVKNRDDILAVAKVVVPSTTNCVPVALIHVKLPPDTAIS